MTLAKMVLEIVGDLKKEQEQASGLDGNTNIRLNTAIMKAIIRLETAARLTPAQPVITASISRSPDDLHRQMIEKAKEDFRASKAKLAHIDDTPPIPLVD